MTKLPLKSSFISLASKDVSIIYFDFFFIIKLGYKQSSLLLFLKITFKKKLLVHVTHASAYGAILCSSSGMGAKAFELLSISNLRINPAGKKEEAK